MKLGFYPHLAWDGIRKNGRLYLPYLLTCIVMVMMYYIVAFLSVSENITNLRGGEFVASFLMIGKFVLVIFSAIFLLYTNAFLMRRRKKEFGLYNVLGMGKRNLAQILFFETLISEVIALIGGILFGVLLSKIAELLLRNLIGGEITYQLTISLSAIIDAVIYFTVVFFILFLNNLRQIQFATAAELVRSENSGEKPPRANWLLGIGGILLLGGAYYIAISIQNPLETLLWFFVAVIMVIIGTYILFIAGSVMLCRILQKNKRYYYKTNHFVSVSSMLYRMKRNGAGLASICILITMVLVMISSTTCLYFGTEGSLQERHSNDYSFIYNTLSFDVLNDTLLKEVPQEMQTFFEKNQVDAKNIQNYGYASFQGFLRKDGSIDTCYREGADYQYMYATDVKCFSIDTYNQLLRTNLTLADDEVLVYMTRSSYSYPSFCIDGKDDMRWKVKQELPLFISTEESAALITPTLFVVFPHLEENIAPLAVAADFEGDVTMYLSYYYGFDAEIPEEMQEDFYLDKLHKTVRDYCLEENLNSYRCASLSRDRNELYGVNGGFFFLGITLSVVFLLAAVLIIYYKQISEGYEDQKRFNIMQKVGMTRLDIKKSINSQLLTVFFLPIVLAGCHLCFAFPMIQKMLMLFSIYNLPLLIFTTLISYLIFALLYTIVYRMTAGAYYKIVNKNEYET